MRDGPPSGGVRCGYREHRKAGVPFRVAASNGELNLRQFVARHPNLRARVDAERAAGRRPASIIDELRLEGHDGFFSVVLWRESGDYIEERFAASPEELREHVAWGMGIRAVGSAELWQLGTDGEWKSIQSWPKEE